MVLRRVRFSIPLFALVCTASTPSVAEAPSRSVDSQTVGSFAARIENSTFEAARETPYLILPDTLAALQAVLISMRAIRDDKEMANAQLFEIGRGTRAALDEIDFQLAQLKRALKRAKFDSGTNSEPDFDAGVFEEAAWYLTRRANDVLPESALVLSVDSNAGSDPKDDHVLVRTRGVRSLTVVAGDQRAPCKPSNEDLFRCPARVSTPGGVDSPPSVEQLTIRDWDLEARVPSWRLVDSVERRLLVPLIVVPDWAARFEVRFDISAIGAQPRVQTADLAVWSHSNQEVWTTELKCVSAAEDWKIDPQSVRLVHQWGKSGKVHGIEELSRDRFCVRLSARGQGFLKGRGRQNVVVEYLEIPEDLEPVTLEPISGQVQYGVERMVKFPTGVTAVEFQIELPDGHLVEGYESMSLPGVNVEVLRDRVVINGTRQPDF